MHLELSSTWVLNGSAYQSLRCNDAEMHVGRDAAISYTVVSLENYV